MEADGLVIRVADSGDRRRMLTTITDKARAIIKEHEPESTRIYRIIETELGAKDLDLLLHLLNRVQRIEFDA